MELRVNRVVLQDQFGGVVPRSLSEGCGAA